MITQLYHRLRDRLADLMLGSIARAVRLVPDTCSAGILADLGWASLCHAPAAVGQALHARPGACVELA